MRRSSRPPRLMTVPRSVTSGPPPSSTSPRIPRTSMPRPPSRARPTSRWCSHLPCTCSARSFRTPASASPRSSCSRRRWILSRARPTSRNSACPHSGPCRLSRWQPTLGCAGTCRPSSRRSWTPSLGFPAPQLTSTHRPGCFPTRRPSSTGWWTRPEDWTTWTRPPCSSAARRRPSTPTRPTSRLLPNRSALQATSARVVPRCACPSSSSLRSVDLASCSTLQ
mmetsp:Transcript_1372/g.5902  ORF Transcript_1372/g.5902 Transcript_1372/m.5902 type:complete len:223 (-) Transcript_1372:576-1244(-)